MALLKKLKLWKNALMLKKLLLLSFLFSANAFSEELAVSGFEEELRILETGQLKAEELEIRNIDVVTGVISDEVSAQQSSVQKEEIKHEMKEDIKEETKIQEAKKRRIRSR